MGVRTMTVYVLGDGSGLSRTLNRATVETWTGSSPPRRRKAAGSGRSSGRT
jgi:hypothetical protein